MFVSNKLIAITNNVNKIINLPETTDKTFTYINKVNGATTGADEAVDFAEAVACQDTVCAFFTW